MVKPTSSPVLPPRPMVGRDTPAPLARSSCRRQHGRPYRPTLGAPHLLQSQSLGLRRLPRPAPQVPADLSRRVRLPLQPPPHPACRISFLARHRRCSCAAWLQDVDLTGGKGISLSPRCAIVSIRSRPLGDILRFRNRAEKA